ncbi:hypothetical protein EJB05_31605, partial [Eragrostis curvula]
MLLLLPSLYLLSSSSRRREKRPRHTSSHTGRVLMEETLNGHEKDCCVAFRMEPAVFKAIATYHRTENLLRDTRGVRVEEQLGMFMFMLSHNSSYEDIQYEFKHIFDTIPKLIYRFFRPPVATEPHWKISKDPRFFPYFKNFIGAIDGTHVPITIAQAKQAPYRNRKGTLSQNVMLACDFDLNFTIIYSGWEGSSTEARVLRSALLAGFCVPEGKFYLIDGGNANTPCFLASYHGVRNHIERAIGVLKKRFPILKVGTHHPMENQVRIPAAAAAFHNLICMHQGDEAWLDNQPNNIPSDTFVDLPEGDSSYNNDVSPLSSEIENGNAVRDNGWSSEAWNLMVRKFHDQFPYVQLTKDQIQDKKKELKRDFNVLKEARIQSGVHWDEKLCMITAEPAIWANIIKSHPKASKFQRKGFPLYDDLEKLYAGKTAEGNFALISVKPKEDDVRIVQPPMAKVTRDGAVGSLAFLSRYHDDYQHDDSDNDDVRIVQPNQRCAATSPKRDKRAADRCEEPSTSGAKVTSTTREKRTVLKEMMMCHLPQGTKVLDLRLKGANLF